jgi:hypothetical protein
VDYELHAFDEGGARTFVGHVHLATDIGASVRSFDLMRANPSYCRVVAVREGFPIFQRVRVGEKLRLEWARRGVATADLAAAQADGRARKAALSSSW